MAIYSLSWNSQQGYEIIIRNSCPLRSVKNTITSAERVGVAIVCTLTTLSKGYGRTESLWL